MAADNDETHMLVSILHRDRRHDDASRDKCCVAVVAVAADVFESDVNADDVHRNDTLYAKRLALVQTEPCKTDHLSFGSRENQAHGVMRVHMRRKIAY